MPQIIALLLVLVVDSLVAPHFYQVVLQDGRLFGSPIDILNRAAPVALLAIGMTLVIATGGIDLSVGAVMAIAGATAASMDRGGAQPADCAAGIAGGRRAGRSVERDPGGGAEDPAVRRHADPDGRRARSGAADHLRADRDL
ncbi:putative D-ribose transport system permease [Klebsiella michiganensis]|nr:putative D-ribose transport system permease [Klebsiella michiganensis]